MDCTYPYYIGIIPIRANRGDMAMINLDEISRLAKAATPGPWRFDWGGRCRKIAGFGEGNEETRSLESQSQAMSILW